MAGGEGVDPGLLAHHVDRRTATPEAMAISSTTLSSVFSLAVAGRAGRQLAAHHRRHRGAAAAGWMVFYRLPQAWSPTRTG